ncbi:cbb3-type cytochrome c oxidase subunit I [Myxosarcina sp. GI1]|uniref:cytochrome c oxidase subunit I n=1 Tax=Myxosarcina sp. GI1 TaxID=1541065 RepID=UPI00055FCF13|nr:cbb3-type cytochrome c oxidase subunit I [Myxosarcina sp. GI1]
MTNSHPHGVSVAESEGSPSESQTNWRRYFSFSTDHKVIGVQYLVTAFTFFLIAGLLAMIVRAELITPASDLVDRPFYNALFTMHGTVMIFLWIIPSLVGLANYVVPLAIGAKDMAFPKLNAIGFWIIPPAGIFLISSFFLPSGAAQAGWWNYPPLSLQNPSGNLLNGELFWVLSIILLGISSIMAAVNFVATIVWLRAPGMSYFRLPIFVWTVLTAQLMQLIYLPALTGVAIMMLADLTIGTHFFQPFDQGDPVLYQHLFWFYSHPTVYVWALPAFGIFSEIIPAFSREPLFGYRSVAIATISFVPITGMVWAHHMFASGTPQWLRIVFMFSTELVAIPTGIKVFAWTATIWRSKLHLETPMLFAFGGVVMFLFAGITGVMLGAMPFDLHVNNTYFVVGHFHYIVYNTITMALFAAIYYWFPKVSGRMYSEGWGKIHFWLTFIGANLTFFPMFPLGLLGMLRRVSSYDPEYAGWNIISSLGGFLLGVSILPFIANIVSAWLQGAKAAKNPWLATGLEWTTTSPPPVENFEEIPIVDSPPYDYGKAKYSDRSLANQ